MGYYYENRKRAQIKNTDPSMTEQSMARDTDINVIVGKFRVTGRVPGAQGQAMGGDFTQVPTDLRAMIDLARDLDNKRRMLPKELRNLTTEQILALTPEELTAKLTPNVAKPENQGRDGKDPPVG